MRIFIVLLCFLTIGCKNGEQKTTSEKKDSTSSSPAFEEINSQNEVGPKDTEAKMGVLKDFSKLKAQPLLKSYSNERFKDVTAQSLGQNLFEIQGKAQIFEASFGWVVEDGHDEIKSGFEMTDAGAPEWGRFKFVVEASKKRQTSTLHLVLFETSAKDGNKQFLLPILLY